MRFGQGSHARKEIQQPPVSQGNANLTKMKGKLPDKKQPFKTDTFWRNIG